MTKIGLASKVDIIEMMEGDENYDQIKDELFGKLGKSAAFPPFETAPGEFMSDSDELIKHFADKNGGKLYRMEAKKGVYSSCTLKSP